METIETLAGEVDGEGANPAEKEASEVLHSLLSVERRVLHDAKEMPSEYEEDDGRPRWHAPSMSQHSVFLTDGQALQQAEYDHQNQQVLWQGHAIQIENVSTLAGGETILQELYPIVTMADKEPEEPERRPPKTPAKKPAADKKRPAKKAKGAPSSGDEGPDADERNRLEDNPLQVKARMKKGCDCKDSCYRGLLPESVYKHRLNIAELTKSEHDMYLMGLTMACLANPSETSRRKARRRLRASYVYQGRRVCLEAFLYLENVTHYQLKRIRHHVMTHGVAPRVHGNLGKKPYNTFSLDIYKHATEFLKQYLEQNGGGSGTTRDLNKTVLVQGDTRRNLFDAYKEYGEILEPGIKLMGYSTFRCFMKDQFPNVRFLPKKPVEPPKDVPFKSGKCMTYDKNKDPARIEAERAKAEAKKAATEAKKKTAAANAPIQIKSDPHQVIVQQQLQTVQTSQNQQVQTVQQTGQHQIVQQMSVQTVGDDPNAQSMEIAQQVIPLTVVQQPQQTYIVTPVSHLQTSVHGTWYSRH